MAGTSQIALLRGINVGGQKMIAMAALRALMEALGLEDPRTLLQSGNAVFRSRMSGVKLEQLLEAEVRKRLSLDVDFMVRTAAEWTSVVEANPFPVEAKADPGHLLVIFLKDAASAASVKALQARITGREVVRGSGRQLYFVYPDGIGRSRLTGTVIEKVLGTRGTARNWNTVLKLRALTGG